MCMRARRSGVLGGLAVVVAVLVGTIPAAAAETTSWASWQPLVGTPGAYTSTVEIAAQPALTATVASDSRGGVGVISGASTWLSEGTPVGEKYGSSIDQQYLNIRPKADNATSPSTTTYSFAIPTPVAGWTFVLGDIDADAVRIRAIAPDGHELDAIELGFQGGFNYCAPGTVGKPSCTGDAADVPDWDPAMHTLTGNEDAADTSGAAAWFEPSTAISSLTFSFTRRAGFPIYQTWFASIAHDIRGSVTDVVDGLLDGTTLTLTDGNGTVVATTTTRDDGEYSFPGFVATDGYTVRVTPPPGKTAEGAIEWPIDLTRGDGIAHFIIRDIIPVSVTGSATDTNGSPIAGVTVTIGDQTTTTDSDGRYLFDQVPVGDHTATITTPGGYTTVVTPPPFTVPDDSEEPITGVDFQLAEQPSMTGTVRANGTGVPGVAVTATGPGGTTLTTVTDATGDYSFPRLASGDYTVTVIAPDGYTASGPESRVENLTDADVENVDFELARLGAFDGTVRTDSGDPVVGVELTVTGPDGPQQLTTDADGSYGLGELPPGTYTISVTPPANTTVEGDATRTIVITAAGEAFVEQDFTLTAVVVTPTPTPDPSSPPPSSDGGAGSLPATGMAPETFAWAGVGAVVLAIGVTLLVLARRRNHHHR